VNRRRQFLIAAGVLFAEPLAVFGQQQGKVWRVGFLVQRDRPVVLDADTLGGFVRGMRELGYVEGRNLVIEWRYADNKTDRMPGLAAELVGLQPNVIVTQGAPATHAARKATSSIPIVMGSVSDPVAAGLVRNLARPEANITGLALLSTEIGPKQLQLLSEIFPKVSRVAVLVNPDALPSALFLRNIQDAGRRSGKTILPVNARDTQELAAGFAGLIRDRADALIVTADPFFTDQRRLIADQALKHRLPCMGQLRAWAEAGMLASFGTDITENYRRAAHYVDKILKGAKPGDLPVEQPTKFDMAINLRTAKALGIMIPQSVMLRADEVIQ
jgi:putative ABC transport system substrate-binding protein